MYPHHLNCLHRPIDRIFKFPYSPKGTPFCYALVQRHQSPSQADLYALSNDFHVVYFPIFWLEGALFRLPYQCSEWGYVRKYQIKARSSLAFIGVHFVLKQGVFCSLRITRDSSFSPV
jgi:hypothetical protein